MGICSSAPVSDYAGVTSPDDADSRPRKDSRAPTSAAEDAFKSSDAQQLRQQSNSSRHILGRSDDIRSLYTFDKVLGKGQFGVSRLVVDNKTGERYACKTISKRKLVNPEDIEDVRREIKVMHHLSGHPNVVTFIGAYEDPYNIHIVMELCTGGELFAHIAAKGHYREKDAAHLMRTVLQVVEHCHAMNVVHRDLKPENFLFKEQGRHRLKAIDFGLSSFFQENKPLKDLVGSPFYMAPEVIKREYGKEADVWSCGVIMYILLCGWPPFYGTSAQQIFRAVLHDALDLVSPPWNTLSNQAKDCVRRMLVRDPSKRATVNEILNHEWMRENGAAPDALIQPEILQRMRQFAGMNRFKKEALKVIATHLPPEEIEGIRQMFVDMDTDGSGTICFEEFSNGLRRRGGLVADSELQALMAEVDLDGNSVLDFQEFLTATVLLGKLQRRENLLAAFSHFDTDKSGYITEDELMEALNTEGLAPDVVASVLDAIDRDKDGRIDYDEFVRMMVTDSADSSTGHNAKKNRQNRELHQSHTSGSRKHTLQLVKSGGWQHQLKERADWLEDESSLPRVAE